MLHCAAVLDLNELELAIAAVRDLLLLQTKFARLSVLESLVKVVDECRFLIECLFGALFEGQVALVAMVLLLESHFDVLDVLLDQLSLVDEHIVV